MSTPLDGAGCWVWDERDGSSTPSNWLQIARETGCSHVLAKAGDGPNRWAFQCNPTVVAQVHDAGLRYIAWTYIYGHEPLAEAAVARWALDQGVDALVLDAEYELIGRYAAVDQFWTALRGAYPDAYIAYAPDDRIAFGNPRSLRPGSYGWTGGNWPWTAFQSNANARLPQWYFSDFQIPPEWCIDLGQAFDAGCQANGIPVLPTFPLWPTNTDPGAIQNAGQLTIDAGMTGASLWREGSGPYRACMQAMAGLNWPTDGGDDPVQIAEMQQIANDEILRNLDLALGNIATALAYPRLTARTRKALTDARDNLAAGAKPATETIIRGG